MARHRFFSRLTLLSLSALTLGAVACSKSSPTEPRFDDLEQPAAASSLTAVTDESRGRGRGGDDQAGDDRRGRGNDDRAGDDRGRGRRGRGNDDRADDDRGRRGRGNRGNDDRPGDRPQAPRAGLEFEAAVIDVDGQTLLLADGTRVIVTGQTQWSNRGDLFTLSQVAGSVAAGDPVRAEGRGDRRADGAIVARTLKVEVDD